MPTLDFKGKSFVYAHHLSVPFRELVIDAKKSLPAKGQEPALDDNLIIHGDNLHALKALLPVYAGKVDCIYIDPPYNTGNEGWCYNDNVRSPLMREWLKKSANPVEKEDLERHDKWLSMMWPRLKLMQELLADDGVIFVSIDDNELHRLRELMDEIFNETHFVGTFVWKRRASSALADKLVSVDHEYVLTYHGGAMESFAGVAKTFGAYSNPDNDPNGDWTLGDLTVGMTKEQRPNQFYDLIDPKTGRRFKANPNRVWAFIPDTMATEIAEGRVVFPEKLESRPMVRRYKKNLKSDVNPISTWIRSFSDIVLEDGISPLYSGLTSEGGKLLQDIFGTVPFNYSKPPSLIQSLLAQVMPKDGIVLDSFAGSGTTAHSVLALNKKDGGNRKFILVETEDYADKLTAERVRRVIQGYKFDGMQREELLREPLNWTKLQKADELVENAKSIEKFEGSRFDKVTKTVENGALVVTGEKKFTEKTEGLGGSFTFVTLGPEMTLDKLLTDGLPAFEALAKYVFFTATGRTLSDVPKRKANSLGFIGETDVYRVHLHYQPDKTWLQSNDAALTEKLVDEMVAANTGKKKLLVFAAAKFMSQRELSRQGVEFCQLPYAIHRILGD